MSEEQQDFLYMREWLAQKLEQDRKDEEERREERTEEQAFEDIRQAWIQETGVEPTWDELKNALREKRNQDVAEAARLNEAKARRAIHQSF